MTLRSKVFFLFSTLLMVLLGSQWFMMRSITSDVSRELGQVAFSVARDTASFFILGEYNWDQHISGSFLLPKVKIQSKIKVERLAMTNKGQKIIVSKQSFVYRPPAVEIRLNNQIEDDFLELITASGTQIIPIERQNMIDTVNKLQTRMLVGTLIILIFGVIIAAYFSHRLSRPLEELSKTAETVASGELGATIEYKGKFISSELSSTIESFNRMSKQLAELDKLKARVRENEHYRELGEIASGLAHSIRNPLNTLGLSIEQLSRDDISLDKRSKLADTASRQIHRVDQWIRSFLTFSLQSSSSIETIELRPLIKDIQLEASQLNNKRINFDNDSISEALIEGVEAELKAILHALIINAFEASPEQGTVKLCLTDEPEQIIIEIIDSGKGLPNEIRDKLFMPHQTTKQRGSGMGLFIAHRLATNRYQGTITLDNRVDDLGVIIGTIVRLTLSKNRIS